MGACVVVVQCLVRGQVVGRGGKNGLAMEKRLECDGGGVLVGLVVVEVFDGEVWCVSACGCMNMCVCVGGLYFCKALNQFLHHYGYKININKRLQSDWQFNKLYMTH